MNKLALEVKGLSAHIGGNNILSNINFVLPQGTWTSVVGPNGVGKSTLLKSLAHVKDFDGLINVFGKNSKFIRPRALAQRLSWLGQNELVGNDLRVIDVVMLGRLPHQAWLASPDASDIQAVEIALRMTKVWDLRERILGQISGGERQRVLLSRALAVNADILLMDEPLINLDPSYQADWMELVKMLVKDGKTVLTVLHDLGIALQADQMLIMKNGEIDHFGACQDLITHQKLIQVFDNRICIHRLNDKWISMIS